MTGSLAAVVAVHGAATDAGLRRAVNEDSFLAAAPLYLVADGMGGHNAGEIASATVVDEFTGLVGRASLTVDEVHAALLRARRRVDALPVGGGAGAGTTLSGIVIAEVDGQGYWLALNLGDSRTYRLSRGVFEQVSVDHSVVQELIDSGQLDAATAADDARRNVITRAIGAGSDGEPDYWLIPAERGDRFLVCSDGLPTEVDATRIREILTAEADPQDAAARLVQEAVRRGGRDNVTALVVDAVAVASRALEFDDHDTTPPSLDVDEVDGDTRPRALASGGV